MPARSITQEALRLLLKLVDDEAKRNMQQEKEKISSVAWFIRDVLANENIVDMQVVKDLEAIINEYPEFAKSNKLTRDLRNDMYTRLVPLQLKPEEETQIVDKIIDTLGRTRS